METIPPQVCIGIGVPMLPSPTPSMDAKHDQSAVLPWATRMYEYKKCHRRFHLFQALGGHSSRCKMQSSDVGGLAVQKRPCFLTGQALGGHMTLHRRSANNIGRNKPLDIDLNLPPPIDDHEEEESDVKWPKKMHCWV
ncbi:hypothetical protein EJ110_NYTH37819 [Nymphaea thermarum]|nr:hypothetical protein EJ110_NYTH37819 [Nymphaea thermarum]